MWSETGRALRRLPAFYGYLEELGLPDYWRGTTWPALCHPTADGFTCD